MRFKIVLLAIVNWIFQIGMAQRPLPIEQVRPKIDSVQIEADLLYAYEKSSQSAIELAENEFEDYLSYKKGDTLTVLLLSKEGMVVTEYQFKDDYSKPFYIHPDTRPMNKEEAGLFQIQNETIKAVDKGPFFDKSKMPDCCTFHYTLIPFGADYKLYALTITNQDSILPFGGDYLFFFDHSLKLLSWEKFRFFSKYSNKKVDLPPRTKIGGVSGSCGGMGNHFILPSDIVKFRLYGHQLNLTKFTAGCNKRIYTYYALTNKIKIHLFPIERK